MPGLGRLRSLDPRNEQYHMHRALDPLAPLQVPDHKTWAFSGHPLDQGDTGTCTGHAAAHFIHAAPIGHKTFLDPFQIYREAVLLDEYPDNDADAKAPNNDGLQAGSSGTGVMKALTQRGVLANFLWAQRLEDALTWCLTRGPVCVGTNWYSSMFNPTKQGFVKIDAAATIAGGHEWLIRGVDKKTATALAVNSWGAKWNDKATGKWGTGKVPAGHFLIDFETLSRLFHEDGDVVSGVEKALIAH
jgi:hypothetical protein